MNTYTKATFLNVPSTKKVQVAEIGTTRTRYAIRFKEPASAEIARNNTEWRRELCNDTKLVKPRFGVSVDHVPTLGLDPEKDKAEAIQKNMEENDLQEHCFQIEDIAWLKKRDKVFGTLASIGTWFDCRGGTSTNAISEGWKHARSKRNNASAANTSVI